MDTNGAFHDLVSQSCSENRNSSNTGTFECNICFDLAQDPIVTLCGHLFCWPCLYKWLQFHSYSHECPVCKSLIKENNLVPIYGRGTSNSDLQAHSLSKDVIPRRPASHRPQTAPEPDLTHFHQDGLGPPGGFMPMSTPRLGNLTRTGPFGAIPSFFNFQVHNTAAYGPHGGIPYLFASYAHGGYAHGFHHYPIYGQRAKSLFLMICFLFLGLLVALLLILSSMF
uniref:E3 ubiquitin-protein ligase RNF185-like n=1 Tax=Erigeron canadensis TaxID=72917 RepID=UPI001CB9368B|nr:E3 ubiquitin-protein ligase RNF185-like [Erigeron canadensis]XP_043629452.1 E3 ubiquitin-protein ligase RNF185-like [Erigeron canadensis]